MSKMMTMEMNKLLLSLARAVAKAANRRRGGEHFETADVELCIRWNLGGEVVWESRIGSGMPTSPRWDAEGATPEEALSALVGTIDGDLDERIPSPIDLKDDGWDRRHR